MELAGVKRKRAVTFSQDSEDTLSPASAGSPADENTTGSTTPGLLPDDTRPPPPQRTALEGFTKCSESLLWKLMMSFYNKKGVES